MTKIAPKTPPKGTSEGPKFESTPQSRGTASDVLYNNDERACQSKNIRLVNIDLEGTQKVEFVSLLIALLARMLLGVSADGKDAEALDGAKFEAIQLFDKMLEDAIGFCNSSFLESANPSHQEKRSKEMKTHLKSFCGEKSETCRYVPISTTINTIMLAYDEHQFGQLSKPCLSDDDRIIVIPNDPLVIESKQIKYDSPTTKRKPDNIIVQLSYLLKLDNTCKHFDYHSWVHSVGTEFKKWKQARKGADEQTSWRDVLSSVELKALRVIEIAPLDLVTSKEQVLGRTSYTPASDVLQSSDHTSESKRRLASQASRSSTGAASSHSCEKKRSHAEAVGSEYASKTTSSQKKPKTSEFNGRFTPETQCAYYAIERLRAAWNVTHSIVLLLEDNMLSIRWYDAEGCIVTQSIDIIGQLPLFVVLVIILQRFDAAMWGLPDIEISQTTENGPVSFNVKSDKAERTRFQLVGRRTFAQSLDDAKITPLVSVTSLSSAATSHVPDDASSSAPVIAARPPTPGHMPTLRENRRSLRLNASNTLQNTSSSFPAQQSPQGIPSNARGSTSKPQPLFFKVAWPENSRDKEPVIIARAISRANQYLGEFKAYVLEHIPTVVSWQEVEYTSTAIIRQLLGFDAKHSRTLIWMLSHKLRPIKILGFHDFWKAFWELIRCHYLLWSIGIAHGDISIDNLMYDDVAKKGIVNDFDLAAIMEPGDISPQKKGWERTGTKPFMALELLDNADGSVKRMYRHDLESFAWCLLWCGMNESFPDEAIYGSTRGVVAYKRSLAFDLSKKTAKLGFEEIWQCIVDWVCAWVWQGGRYLPEVEDPALLATEFAEIVGKHKQGILLDDPQDPALLLRVFAEIVGKRKQAVLLDDPQDPAMLVREFTKIIGKHEHAIPLDDPQLKWVDFQVPLQVPSSSKDANAGDVIVS